MLSHCSIVIFDLGGVLIDWNPRYLYRKLFNGDEQAMEHFLANICSPAWNKQQDAGRSFAEGCAFLKAVHPGATQYIDAWFDRYDEMLAGPILRHNVESAVAVGLQGILFTSPDQVRDKLAKVGFPVRVRLEFEGPQRDAIEGDL
jgi:hypothetical protein